MEIKTKNKLEETFTESRQKKYEPALLLNSFFRRKIS